MKTLYISDLDGTLLNSKRKLSAYTCRTINTLTQRGICFSYATARSLSSASIVTKGLNADIPVIVYNGGFIIRAKTGEILSSLYFTREQTEAVARFFGGASAFPLVYSFVDKRERVSFLEGTETAGIARYLKSRKGDKRLRPVEDIKDLYAGDVFYFTLIGDREDLLEAHGQLRERNELTCTFQQELYLAEHWLEIMPRGATKGNAVRSLKNILGCDRVVSFGDAINDIPMFLASDECYAVKNAVDELKSIATAVIGSNDEDAVAHWLEDNA